MSQQPRPAGHDGEYEERDLELLASTAAHRSLFCLHSTITLVAVEAVRTPERSLTRQLHHSLITLWESPTSDQASSSSQHDNNSEPPAIMPFQFTLPEHLPHCVHLPNIKLEYRLVATLYPPTTHPQRTPIRKAVLVHVTRYSPPNPARELVSPELAQKFRSERRVWNLTEPTAIDVTLSKTLVRRAEQLRVKVKIHSPNEKALGKGLRIRSVEAELVRVVKVQPWEEDDTLDAGGFGKNREKGKASDRTDRAFSEDGRQYSAVQDHHHRATADGWQPHGFVLYPDEDATQYAAGPSSAASSPVVPLGELSSPRGIPPPPFEEQQFDISTTLQTAASEAPPAFTSQQVSSAGDTDGAETLSDSSEEGPSTFETVLSHTGKSCRFSLRRPLVLHLTLRPPFSSPTLPHPSPDHDAPSAGVSPLRAGRTGGGGGCESISMTTGLIEVEFKVRISIRLRRGGNEEGQQQGTSDDGQSRGVNRAAAKVSNDVVLEQTIHVMPGLAGEILPITGEECGRTSGIEMQASIEDDILSEEEFDGYEDFQDDVNDSFSNAFNDLPRLSINEPSAPNSGGDPAPPAFDGGQGLPSLTVNGNPAYSTVRALDDGDDLLPNHEQSQHDIQIFPTHVIELPEDEEGEDDGQAAFPPGSPPAFQEESAGRQEIIEGVGHGERRRAPAYLADPSSRLASWQQGSAIDRLRSPPPNFETSSNTELAGSPTDSELVQSQQNPTVSSTEPPPYAQPPRRPGMPIMQAPSYAEETTGQASAPSSSQPASPTPQLDQGSSSRAGLSSVITDSQSGGGFMSAEQEKAILAEAARREAEMDSTTFVLDSTSPPVDGELSQRPAAHLPPAYTSHLPRGSEADGPEAGRATLQGAEEVQESSLISQGSGQDGDEQRAGEEDTTVRAGMAADEPPGYEA